MARLMSEVNSRLNLRLHYPASDKYFYQTSLERIDLDKECLYDITNGKGFIITAQKPIKDDLKDMDGIFSPRFGRGLQDLDPYSDRYKCRCGDLKGAFNKNQICKICHTPVTFVDDDFSYFGWVRLKDEYCFIHPGLFMSIASFIGYDNLMDIIKIQEKKDEDGYICKVDINFKNIHGKKRKQIKYAMKKNKIEIPMQATLWNKYVGKKDVLYVHARMGYKGSQVEWAEEWNNLINHPDFLGWIPDYIGDSSYCDIYIRIHPENIPDVEAFKALMKKAIDDKEWQKAVEIAEYLNDIIKEDDPFHTTLNILLPRLYDELKKVDSFISD